MSETSLNYFTEIEEHFRRARGTPLFRLSPLDWALIDAWENGGIPLEAVLRGIDVAFEKWRRRPAQARTEMVNSLAYCSQAIAVEVQALANATCGPRGGTSNPVPIEHVRRFITDNAVALRNAGHQDLAKLIEAIDLDTLYDDVEKLEQRLTKIEEELTAKFLAAASDVVMRELRCALEQELKPYPNKMTADQLKMLEERFLGRRLLESASLPRLSLFYM
jgi:hypothetical protein